ncbi:MAG: hypothetical protein MJ078_08745, partial [Clostridia bacterium]|nr:hypothetical protein [Clostridia bacterium]
AEKESGSDRSESGSETGNVSGGVEARGETTSGNTSGSKKSKDAGKSGKTQESGTSGQSQTPTTPAQQETTGSKEASNLPAMTFTGTAKEYEAYCSLSVEDQYEIFKKYFGYTKAEVARYNNWYQTAKKAYQQEHPAVTLEPGVVIDLGN